MRRRANKQHADQAPAGAAASELPAAAPNLDLPTSVLTRILAQQPLKLRLGTCSLVSRAWAAAAAEATTAVSTSRDWKWKQQHYDALAAWLRNHGPSAGLQQLAFEDPYRERRDEFSPPWQQLQTLRVLRLKSCVLPAGSMRQLSALTALTELSLCSVACSSSSSQVVTRSQAREQQQKNQAGRPARSARQDLATAAATASELARTLPRLPALVSLKLDKDSSAALLPALTATPPAAAAGVNFLQQQLASLKLSKVTCITPELLVALPGSLTFLELQAVGPGMEQYTVSGWDITDKVLISQASTPRLGQLTQLQELHLKGIGVDVSTDGSEPGSLTALFSKLMQLTAFSINGHKAVAQHPLHDTGGPELVDFMSAMGCLTGLRSLQMTGGFRCEVWDWDDEPPWWELEGQEPPGDYAPLTAALLASSSHLTRLHLQGMSLPQGCGPHMFGRPGLRLPHLAELYMEGYQDFDGMQDYYADRYLTADDVRSIVSCCEGGCLRKLTLEGVVQGWKAIDWGVLSALTSLTYLYVDASTTGVEKLVSLVELHLRHGDAPDETLAAIATHLTRLMHLSAWDLDLSERAQESSLTESYDRQAGMVGADYFLTPPEECEEYGVECVPVCEQLARDLRVVGILPPPPAPAPAPPAAVAEKRKAAAGGCQHQ